MFYWQCKRSLADHRTHQLVFTSWITSRDHPVSISPAWGLQVCTAMLGISLECWNPNAGPEAYTGNASLSQFPTPSNACARVRARAPPPTYFLTLSVCMCVATPWSMHVWMLENNLWELVLFSITWVPGPNLGHQAGKHLSWWVI